MDLILSILGGTDGGKVSGCVMWIEDSSMGDSVIVLLNSLETIRNP